MIVWWMTINRAMGNSYLDLKYRKVIAQKDPKGFRANLQETMPFNYKNKPSTKYLINPSGL
jgi:hypothetical protein